MCQIARKYSSNVFGVPPLHTRYVHRGRSFPIVVEIALETTRGFLSVHPLGKTDENRNERGRGVFHYALHLNHVHRPRLLITRPSARCGDLCVRVYNAKFGNNTYVA